MDKNANYFVSMDDYKELQMELARVYHENLQLKEQIKVLKRMKNEEKEKDSTC